MWVIWMLVVVLLNYYIIGIIHGLKIKLTIKANDCYKQHPL